jgi:hypothetical protein
MRTRRSWRNQDRLWKALGGPQPKPTELDPVALAERTLANCEGRHRAWFEQQLRNAKFAALMKESRR